MDRQFLRSYYQSALDANRRDRNAIYWSDQEAETPDTALPWLKVGAVGGAAFMAGSLPFGKGNVWDKYVGGLRHFEEYFFGRIPRTLQLSNIFSQFESSANSLRTISPTQIGEWGKGHLSYLETISGVPSYRIAKEGLRFENGKLSLGISGDTVLEHAGVIRNLNKSPHFSAAYARSAGVDLGNRTRLFHEVLPFTNAAGQVSEEAFQFIGGHTRAEAFKRQAYGIGTEFIERANRLANAQFELPVIEKLAASFKRKVGLSPDSLLLGVKSGGGLETLGRLTGKLGLLGGAAYLGYQYADYAVRNIDLFNHTAFDKGLTTGFANMWTNANLAYAKFGDTTGWTESAKNQETYAPGSTSLQHLAAFPIIGAVGAGAVHYAQRAFLMGKLEFQGRSVERASAIASRALRGFRGTGLVSRLGRFLRESRWSIARSIGSSRLGTMAAIGATLGAIPTLPFLFNALAPGQSESELTDIYSGKQEVAIRKGRYWELGGTKYEGDNIQYYSPSWYAKLQQGSTDKGIWGSLEAKEGRELSPIERLYKENFTYDLEQEHYYDRPYPISGRAFQGFPIIGPILSATIGQIFKPSLSMHSQEYINSQGAYAQLPPGFGKVYATDLGEGLPGAPISSHGLKNLIGEETYRLGELSGLPGFLGMSIKQAITGTQTPYEDVPQLQSADEMYGAARQYYDASLGGMAGSNELFRRLLPHKRNQLKSYNPIRNNMADWLPGPDERGPDLLHGDPYSAIPLGEVRLPGVGYAERFPELKGLDSSQYPLIHRYKILADVAPFTDKFDYVASQVRGLHNAKSLSPEEEAIYQQTEDQLKAKRDKKTFNEYKYRDRNLDPVAQAMADTNDAPLPTGYESLLGSYWETLSHNMETPFEQLSPVEPAAKLLHMRTALEDYEKTQIFGSSGKFWDRPWANFIHPFLTSSTHALGDNSIPGATLEKRNIEEYFDMLKYIKYTRLKSLAQEGFDFDASSEFEQKRRETLFGVNPFSFDYSEIFRALPRRERDYFTSFSQDEDLDDRAKILGLVPDNEKALYQAKWEQLDRTQFQKAQKLGILTDDQIEAGNQKIAKMYDEMSSEGLPKTQDLWKEYIATRMRNESYPDWYRRTKLIDQKARSLGLNIPGPDWVGFNPNVDLDDIKLKMVSNLSESIQDYDLWPDRERGLLYKPFINDQAIQQIQQPYDTGSLREHINSLLVSNDISDSQVEVTMVPGSEHKVELDIQDDRTRELREKMRAS